MAVADVPENADADKGMSNSKKIALTIILALLLAGFSYGGYSWWSGAPFRNAMAMIEEDVDFSTLSKDDQKARFEKWRTLDKKLTSDQKSQLNDARERQYEKKDMQKLNTFFAMTKAEQKKQLVDEVNRDEKRRIEGEAKRKEWEAKRAQGNNQKVAGAQGGGKGGNADGGKGGGRGGNADGGKGGGNQPAAGGKGAPPAGGNQVAVVAGAQGGGKVGNADGGKGGGKGGAPGGAGAGKAPDGANAAGRGQGGAPNAGGANGNGQGGGNQPAAGGKGAPPAGGNQVAVVAGAPQQGGRPPSTPESRNKRTSDRLDNSTPEYRAAKMEYQKLRDKTRAEMGIVTTPGGGGRPGGAPGGGTPGGKRG